MGREGELKFAHRHAQGRIAVENPSITCTCQPTSRSRRSIQSAGALFGCLVGVVHTW